MSKSKSTTTATATTGTCDGLSRSEEAKSEAHRSVRDGMVIWDCPHLYAMWSVDRERDLASCAKCLAVCADSGKTAAPWQNVRIRGSATGIEYAAPKRTI